MYNPDPAHKQDYISGVPPLPGVGADHLVLKFYEYTPIANPYELCGQQYDYCYKHGLKGRIKIAEEGINATLSGLVKDCIAYMRYLREDKRFAAIQFNVTPSFKCVHEKLHVVVKKEIVYSGLPAHIVPSTDRKERHYIDVATFQQMCQEKDVVLVDVRSRYEHQLGKFENAVTFDIGTFREFPAKASAYPFSKDKRYVVICTRGIKSEKARDYLRCQLGLPHVFHLEGGILDYAQHAAGEGFRGVCYVFDNRVVVPINKVNPTLISKCYGCQVLSARMVNCANPVCNLHVPMCTPCYASKEGACSAACQKHPLKRPYSKTGYYKKLVDS